MKYKSLKTPDQIIQVLSLLFDRCDPYFENDYLKGIEFVEPSTGCKVKIAKPDNYGESLSIMVEEPEGVIPNGFRLFGRYKNLIDINEFFESFDDLEKRVCAITGWTSYDGEDLSEYGLSIAKTAVILAEDKFMPVSTPLLIQLEAD